MTLKKVKVKPRHGIILAGIPAEGAVVEGKLAKEWLENGLVTEVEDEDEPKAKEKPAREES